MVAIVLFFGVLLLSVERDEEGTWGFAMVSALADGESGSGEDGNNVQPKVRGGEHRDLTNSRGFKDVVGMYVLINPPGTNPGAASVTLDDIVGSIVWSKTSDDSGVGVSGSSYNISYQASYSHTFFGTGSLVVIDAKVENF